MGSKPRRTASSVMAVCHATQSARHAVRSVGHGVQSINRTVLTISQLPVRPVNHAAGHPMQSVGQSVSQSVVQHIRSHNGIGLSVLPISQHTRIIRSPSMHAAHSLARCSQTVTRCKQSASRIVQSVSHDVKSVSNAHTRSPSVIIQSVCAVANLSQSRQSVARTRSALSHAASQNYTACHAHSVYTITLSLHITMIPQSFELVGARCYGPISRGVRPAGHKGE